MPPALVAKVQDGTATPLDRFTALKTLVDDYLLTTRTNGQLAFYLPAPNPPLLFNPNGTLVLNPDLSDPKAVMDSIKSVVMDQASVPAYLYRSDLAFLGGYLDGTLLGVPMGHATLLGRLPVGQTEGVLEFTAGIDPGSWLTNFVDKGSFTAVLRQRPAKPVEEVFSEFRSRLATASSDPQRLALVSEGLARLNDALPKGSVEARFANFRLPPGYNGLFTLPPNRTDLQLYAYSTLFNPKAMGAGPVADVQRLGGFAMRTSVRVLGLVDIPDLELSVVPVGGAGVLLFGSVPIPSIDAGVFRLASADGKPMRFSATADGLAISGNTTLQVAGVDLTASRDARPAGLAMMEVLPFTIARDGSFRAPLVPGFKLRLGSFDFASLDNAALVRTAAGVVRLEFSGALGNAPLPAVAVAGTLASDGTVNVSGTANSAPVHGFTLASVSATMAGVAPKAVTLTLAGDLALAGIDAARLTGTFGSPSQMALGVTLGSPMNVAGFGLEGASLQLGAQSLRVAGGIRFAGVVQPFDGVFRPDGSLALSNRVVGAAYRGFPAGGITNILQRGASGYGAAVLASAPRAYWRLNDAAVFGKTNVVDSAGGPAGILVGRVAIRQSSHPLSDPANRSMAFATVKDGENAFVAFGGDNAKMNYTRVSLEAWIRVSSFTRNWQAIVTKGDTAWRLHRYAATDQVAFGTSGLDVVADLPSTRPLRDDQWHHVVGVYDGRAKYLYVDGALDAWQPASGDIASNTADVAIGNNSQQPERGWNGYLDEVAVYDRALSPAEVMGHYLASGRAGVSVSGRFGFAGASGTGQFNGVDFAGAMSAAGDVALQGSATALRAGGFELPGASMAFVARAQPASAELRVWSSFRLAGVFNRDLAGMSGSVDNLGRLNASLTGETPAILGFGFQGVAVSLKDVSLASLSGQAGVTATLALPNAFPAVSLAGSVGSAGAVNLTSTLNSLSLGGLPLAAQRTASVQLLRSPDRLAVSGGFGPAFGTVDFTGNVAVDGTYALRSAANLSPTIGGKPVTFATAMTLANSGLSGTGRVAFGSVNVDVAMSQPAGGGLSVSGSTGDVDTAWLYYGPGNGYPAGRLRWNVAVSYANGTLGATVSGTAAGWQRQPTTKFVCDVYAPNGTCLFGHFESNNDNRPPTGADWPSQVPNGAFADTFKAGFGPQSFSGGNVSIKLPFPFNNSLDALLNKVANFDFGLSRP